nr:hypothetical protein Iba_scaffold57726CG0010 [Ipomoea batatas]GMD85467.1 hypothetical protein Iba_chr14aCG24630 [Ipomoea batatas]
MTSPKSHKHFDNSQQERLDHGSLRQRRGPVFAAMNSLLAVNNTTLSPLQKHSRVNLTDDAIRIKNQFEKQIQSALKPDFAAALPSYYHRALHLNGFEKRRSPNHEAD